ncbi:MAG: nucleotidyltransferase family protein [bacterium]
MRGIILSAGRGTRLGHYTQNMPKVMMEIGGKPVLEHGILLFKKHGIENLCINLHHCPEVIQNYFADGHKWGVNIQYNLEKELLGTAGAVKAFEELMDEGEKIMVLYGDNLTDCDLTALRRFHERKKALLTMAFIEEDEVSKSGILAFDHNCRVVRMVEKPKPEEIFSHYVNAGILLLEHEVLDLIPKGEFYDFGYHLLPRMIREERGIYAYPMNGYLISLDTPEYYQKAQEYFRFKGKNLE